MDWLDLLAVQGTQESSPTPQFKSIIFLYSPTLTYIHDYWKNHSFDWWTFTGKVTSLLFNMLSRLVITSLPRSKHFMAAVTICSDFRAQKIKVCHCFPIYLPWCDEAIGPDAMILVFWMLSFKSIFSLSSFILIKRLSSSSLLSVLEWYLHIWSCWYFFWHSWFQLVSPLAWHFAWCTLYIS